MTNPSDEMSAVFTQKSPYHRQCRIRPFQHCCQDRTELLCSSVRTGLVEKEETGVEVLPNAELGGRDPVKPTAQCDELNKM